MTQALKGKVFGFTLHQRKSRRHPEVKITEADFADDLALQTKTLEEAQEFLLSFEKASNAVGLHLNESKTKYLPINSPSGVVKASSGWVLDAVDDIVYLGAHLDNPEHQFVARKTKAWAACHQIRRQLTIRLFIPTVESILIYGTKTWTITAALASGLMVDKLEC